MEKKSSRDGQDNDFLQLAMYPENYGLCRIFTDRKPEKKCI
jgi:hypothetical protein